MDTNLRLTHFSTSLYFRAALSFASVIAVLAATSISSASDTLAYSFENDLQGFAGNGGGISATQDTIGATDGTHSMRVDEVGGQTFAGALTGSLDPTIIGDPPGIDHVMFDMTITQRFGTPNPTPPPDFNGFARIGVTIFGVTQPDSPGGQSSASAQLENRGVTEVPIDGREPGTYRDLRISLLQLSDPLSLTGGIKSFNDIFGTIGSGPNDIIPTGFQFYFNKTPGIPLTVYIDNVRFGTTPAGVPGDYNGNGVVDMADYVLWRNGGPLQNEIADAGTVSAADYTAWRGAFGNHAGSGSGSGLGSAAVPEPTTGLLLLAATAIFLVTRRKHAIN